MQTELITDNAYMFFFFFGVVFIAIAIFAIIPEEQKVKIQDSGAPKRKIVSAILIGLFAFLCYWLCKRYI